MQSDQAAVESAQATLAYTTVKAPIDGRTGIRQVDEGNIVHASDSTGIVVITEIQPISVLFNLPQQYLKEVNDAFAKGPLEVDAQRSDNDAVIDKGTLTVVDNQVDASTGTVKLKAEFPNAELQLWPGQFVNVRLLINTLQQVVVIPTGAVQRGPTGTFVYVVKDDNSAAIRPIVVQKQDETQTVVKSGVTPPERVVTTGFARLTDGSKVQIGSDTPPAAAPAARTPAWAKAAPALPAPPNANRAPTARRGLHRSNERILPIHSPADRHLPARRRGDAGAARSVIGGCRCRRCRRSTSRPYKSPRNCRAPIPTPSPPW